MNSHETYVRRSSRVQHRPLIALARVEMAWLLSRLFPEVVIPEEVREELFVRESPDQTHHAEALKSARMHPRQSKLDRLLLAELDAGKAAVMAAALLLGHPAVILDERKARRITTHVYGLQVKGSSGLLVGPKACGLIDNVRPYLDRMIQGGYYVRPQSVCCMPLCRRRVIANFATV